MTEKNTAEGVGQSDVGVLEEKFFGIRGRAEESQESQGKFLVNSLSLECVRLHDRGFGCDEC